MSKDVVALKNDLQNKSLRDELSNKFSHIPEKKREGFINMEILLRDCNKSFITVIDFIDLINKFENGSHLFILKNDYNDKYALGYDHIVPCIKFSDSTTFDKDDCGEYLKIVNNDNSFAVEKHFIKDIVAVTYTDGKDIYCKYLLQ